MSFVRIEQRNARLAAAVKLDQIKGREGFVTKGTVVVLSNVRKGEGREDEVTSILWTLWGKQAENASARRAPHVVSHRFMPKVSCGLPAKQSLHFVSSQPTSSSSQ